MDELSNSNQSKKFPSSAADHFICRNCYFETSHGKPKSDELGGVVKPFVSRSVKSEGTVVRNTMEFYQFCTENLTF